MDDDKFKEVLRAAFKQFVDNAILIVDASLSHDQKNRIRHANGFEKNSVLILDIVGQIEKSIQFSKFVLIYSIIFSKKSESEVKKELQEPEFSKSSSVLMSCLKHYFRVSNFYVDLFERSLTDINNFFEKLWACSKKRTIKKITFHILEDVWFPERCIDFGSFKIQKFSKNELDFFVNNKINKVFYRYSEIYSEYLKDRWFVVTNTEKMLQRVHEWGIIDFNDETFQIYRDFPEHTMQLLSLFDWEVMGKFSEKNYELNEIYGLINFSTPWDFSITDDCLRGPLHHRELPELLSEPFFDNLGNEVGSKPAWFFELETSDSERLKKTVIDAQNFLNDIDLKSCGWDFVLLSLGYLAKAFFTKDGFEQLLWHMTVLEILLGEKNGIGASVKRGLCIVNDCNTNAKRKEVNSKFDELYDLRSDLVHGNPMKKKGKEKAVFFGHIKYSRMLARKSLVWFIENLGLIHRELQKNNIPLECYPDRLDLHYLFDLHLKKIKGTFDIQNFMPILISICETRKKYRR